MPQDLPHALLSLEEYSKPKTWDSVPSNGSPLSLMVPLYMLINGLWTIHSLTVIAMAYKCTIFNMLYLFKGKRPIGN